MVQAAVTLVAAAAAVVVAVVVVAVVVAAVAVPEPQQQRGDLAFSSDSELLEVVPLSWFYPPASCYHQLER